MIKSTSFSLILIVVAQSLIACRAEQGAAELSSSACPIIASEDWIAWINAMPGDTPPTLNIRGDVELDDTRAVETW